MRKIKKLTCYWNDELETTATHEIGERGVVSITKETYFPAVGCETRKCCVKHDDGKEIWYNLDTLPEFCLEYEGE